MKCDPVEASNRFNTIVRLQHQSQHPENPISKPPKASERAETIYQNELIIAVDCSIIIRHLT
jgi:hypothetical protein